MPYPAGASESQADSWSFRHPDTIISPHNLRQTDRDTLSLPHFFRPPGPSFRPRTRGRCNCSHHYSPTASSCSHPRHRHRPVNRSTAYRSPHFQKESGLLAGYRHARRHYDTCYAAHPLVTAEEIKFKSSTSRLSSSLLTSHDVAQPNRRRRCCRRCRLDQVRFPLSSAVVVSMREEHALPPSPRPCSSRRKRASLLLPSPSSTLTLPLNAR